jgi:hypothetical protein
MKKNIFILCALLVFPTLASARVRYVDQNGSSGKFTTVQSAIDAAIDGDTVRIYPGIYPEQVTIGKNIIVQGGGALNTIISVQTIQSGAVVTMTAGKLMWVGVTSSADGISINVAKVNNCIVYSCTGNGLVCTGPNGNATNCIASGNNAGYMVENNGNLTATNCIAINNRGKGFASCAFTNAYGTLTCRYCDASGNQGGEQFTSGCMTETGDISTNPSISSDYRLSTSSPCVSGGAPTLLNLDASRSDMGYYGGPDAPLLPYVTLPGNIKLNPDGTITFDMLGKVGY